MGACASKFRVWKSAADAAPPEEVVSRDVNLAENLDKKDGKSEVPATDESKRQLLGNLLKENEVKDGTFESSGKLSVVKEDAPKDISLEIENVKSSEPVCDAPAQGDDTVVGSLTPKESKAIDENPVKLFEESEECKPALETGKDLAEISMNETLDKKPDGHVDTRNLETHDCDKIKDQQPDSVVEKVILEVSEKKPEELETAQMLDHLNTDRPIGHKCGDTSEVKTSL